MLTTANEIRIVLADPDSTFRHNLGRLLSSEGNIAVLGETHTLAGATNLAGSVRPDILLLSLALCQNGNLAALKDLIGYPSNLRLVVMLPAIEKDQILRALELGARGIVLRTSTPTDLVKHIRSIIAGHYWLGNETATVLVEALREFFSQGDTARSLNNHGLTSRELEIVEKIAHGCSNKEVGQNFAISERTVKHHLTNIFSKVGVSSRLELAMFAVNHGLMKNQSSPLEQESVDQRELA